MHRGSNAPLLFCNLKLYNMDKGTLIKVVAMLDARIKDTQKVLEDTLDVMDHSDYCYMKGYEFALLEVSNHLQKAIDADVAAMESSTGE
jgi:hypothetical protein